jgi:uncharacterized protein
LSKPIESRVDTIFIHVTDLERSIKWYSELLGLEVREGSFSGPVYTLHMGAGRPGITLDNHSFDEEYTFIPSNQPLFNISAADIDEAFKKVKQMGAEIVTGVITHPDMAEFSFKDPDGNILMVCTCFS